MDGRLRLAMATLVACGITVLAVIRWQEQSALEAALASYRQESAEHARGVAHAVADTFDEIYSGLRTMARMPGVRTVDRHGAPLSGDARVAAQEIYNDLATSVSMSEVYVVPREFDPEATDPVTGEPEEPIATFDELIVGRTGGASHDGPAAPVEEIEIEEYRLMREQLARFVQRYAAESRIAGLDYPAAAGREVVTCDNTRFDPRHPDDADRSGIVYSVPFYGANGDLKGMVSGVILTSVLRELMPGGDYALHHRGYRYVAGSAGDGPWRQRLAAIHEDRPADDLLYSEVLPLGIRDLDESWSLWVGRPDSTYEAREDVRAAHRVARVGYAVTVLVTALLLLLLRANHQRRRAIEQHAAELERRVAERTAELRDALVAVEAGARAKSQLLANLSHEMRTPIDGMLGMNEVLRRSSLDERQRRCVETIQSSGAILSAIVGDVLDLSRIEAGALTLHEAVFDVRELVEELAGSLCESAYSKGLTLHCDVAPSLVTQRRGDSLRLRQVLSHLLSNAIRFTTRGSVVVSVRAGDGPAQLRCSVRDTGIGIAPDDRQRIFHAFVQVDEGHARRYGGAGLGLSLVTGLVRLMGGTLSVDSDLGLGSEFRFTVHMPAVAAAVPVPLRGAMRVLVVDENSMDRSILGGYFRYCGCTVSVVDSVAAATALCAEAAGSSVPFDVLAVGSYGPAAPALAGLAQLADGCGPRAPQRLLFAPLRDHPSEAEIRAAGVARVLCKPLRYAEIRACVDALRGAAAPVRDTAPGLQERLTGRVLVAEDNPVNQEVARALLEMTGLTVDLAGDGAAAVEAWERGAYDLLFMDCQMPGMSGYDAAGAIRAREQRDGRARTPIVALTAHAPDDHRERCIEAGMDDCLSKPFTDRQLRELLGRWLPHAASAAVAARA